MAILHWINTNLMIGLKNPSVQIGDDLSGEFGLMNCVFQGLIVKGVGLQ